MQDYVIDDVVVIWHMMRITCMSFVYIVIDNTFF
jgi:hypothetical protein